jgi:hypothetical protein
LIAFTTLYNSDFGLIISSINDLLAALCNSNYIK